MLFLFFVLVLTFTTIPAYFIADRIYKGLVKNNSKYPRLIQAGVGLGIFLVLLLIIGYVIGNNLVLRR